MQSVPPNFQTRFAYKRSTFYNYLFLSSSVLIFSFVYLFKICKLFVIFFIRHIAWCIFIRFVNKSYMMYCVVLLLESNLIRAIDAKSPLI